MFETYLALALFSQNYVVSFARREFNEQNVALAAASIASSQQQHIIIIIIITLITNNCIYSAFTNYIPSSRSKADEHYTLQEPQLPLSNRASATYFFVAKLLSIAVMTCSYVR